MPGSTAMGGLALVLQTKNATGWFLAARRRPRPNITLGRGASLASSLLRGPLKKFQAKIKKAGIHSLFPQKTRDFFVSASAAAESDIRFQNSRGGAGTLSSH